MLPPHHKHWHRGARDPIQRRVQDVRRMTDHHALREIMRTHLEHVRAAARDNEFVDAAEAIRLHMLLAEALESWEHLDADQREVLADAVHYLVRTDKIRWPRPQ
jgi:hypothetical protein